MNKITRAKDVNVGDEMVIRVKYDGKRQRVNVGVSDIIETGSQMTFVFFSDTISPRTYRKRKRVEITGNGYDQNDEPEISSDQAVEREHYREYLEGGSREDVVKEAQNAGMKINTKTTKKAAIEFLVRRG